MSQKRTKIINTVQALRNMTQANGCTQNEEQTAKRKAQQMVTLHVINKDELETYDDAVQQGRNLVEKQGKLKWEIGDLAIKVAGRYKDKTMEQYAEDIGINPKTLEAYVTAARKWPKPTRVGSWKTHQVLNTLDDRFKIMEENPKLSKRQAETIVQEYYRAKEAEAAAWAQQAAEFSRAPVAPPPEPRPKEPAPPPRGTTLSHEMNALNDEMHKFMQSYQKRMYDWYIANKKEIDASQTGKSALMSNLYVTANQLMELAQLIDGR